MAEFPTGLPSFDDFNPTDTLQESNHSTRHNKVHSELSAVIQKLGIDNSLDANSQDYRVSQLESGILVVEGNVSSILSDMAALDSAIDTVASDLAALSSVAATLTGTQNLTNKTLVTPTIASLVNAQHGHTDAASGGSLGNNAVATSMIQDQAVTSRKAKLSIVGVNATSTNPMPASETDVVSSSVTFTLDTASYLLVTMFANLQTNGTSNATVKLNVDGSNESNVIFQRGSTSGSEDHGSNSKTYRLSLAAGSHTIKMREVASASSSCVASSLGWWALVVSQ